MRMGRCRRRRTPPYASYAASLIGHSDPTPGSARTPAGNVLIAAGWRKPLPTVTKRDTTRCIPRHMDRAGRLHDAQCRRLAPEVLEPMWRQLGIPDRVLDILVPEP